MHFKIIPFHNAMLVFFFGDEFKDKSKQKVTYQGCTCTYVKVGILYLFYPLSHLNCTNYCKQYVV
jgi:hypothetical protein